MLEKYLKENRIQHIHRVESWEEAIKLAASPLLEDGVISQGYIKAMLESVELNGPYIVLKESFALPHAKAGEYVNEVGLSLLVIDEPIDLKGNPVKVFLVLAAVDNSSHLEALSKISELLMNEEVYQKFLAGNLEEIKKILYKGAE